MIPESKLRILSHLERNNVPLQHSVQLICKADGIALGELVREMGFHRNHLYQTLSGIRRPSKAFRDGISKRLSVDPWAYCAPQGEPFDGSSRSLARVLEFLQQERVPLQHSVSMICKAKGIALGKLAVSLGIHRNYLFQTLSGQRKPSTQLRSGVEKYLGVDPWDYAPTLEASA